VIDERSPAGPPGGTAWDRFWFPAVPAARLEIFRRAVYGFVWLDLLVLRPWVRHHGSIDADLYDPLLVARALPLPVPTDTTVTATMVVLLAGSALGLAGRSSRLVGLVTAVAYVQWMVIAFSFGKVDHDRFALVVALFVVATVGRVDLQDRSPSRRAGWALQMVCVATVAVYFLSVVAKVRYGGWLWANSATLTQAVWRRGTFLGRPLLDDPAILLTAQWAAVVFEATSPMMLVRHRVRWLWWASAVGFHAVTYAVISIAFFPQLVCLLAFLPLERVVGAGAVGPQEAERKASATSALHRARAG
jgi:hypothetical protein